MMSHSATQIICCSLPLSATVNSPLGEIAGEIAGAYNAKPETRCTPRGIGGRTRGGSSRRRTSGTRQSRSDTLPVVRVLEDGRVSVKDCAALQDRPAIAQIEDIALCTEDRRRFQPNGIPFAPVDARLVRRRLE